MARKTVSKKQKRTIYIFGAILTLLGIGIYMLIVGDYLGSKDSSAGVVTTTHLHGYQLDLKEVSTLNNKTNWKYTVTGVTPPCRTANVTVNSPEDLENVGSQTHAIVLRVRETKCTSKNNVKRPLNITGSFQAEPTVNYVFIISQKSIPQKSTSKLSLTLENIKLTSNYTLSEVTHTWNYSVNGKTSMCYTYDVQSGEKVAGKNKEFDGRVIVRLVKKDSSSGKCDDLSQTISVSKEVKSKISGSIPEVYLDIRYRMTGQAKSEVKVPSKKKLKESPDIWFMVTSKAHETGTLPSDYKRIFSHPNEWENGLKGTDVFIFGYKARSSDLFEPSFLKTKVVPTLKKNNVEIGFDSGFATWLTCRKAQGERNIQNDLSKIQEVINAGGEVKYIRLQSSLSKPIPSNLKGNCPNYSMDDRIKDIVRYTTSIKKKYPNIKFGLVDATTSHVLRSKAGVGDNYTVLFPKLIAELKKNNVDLDFIILDTSVENSMGIKHAGAMEYNQLLELEKFVKEKLKIKFGIIVVSQEGGETSNKLFYDRTVKFVKEYKKRGGNPDFYFPESWYKYPHKLLPESGAPTPTHTETLLEIIRIVKGK